MKMRSVPKAGDEEEEEEEEEEALVGLEKGDPMEGEARREEFGKRGDESLEKEVFAEVWRAIAARERYSRLMASRMPRSTSRWVGWVSAVCGRKSTVGALSLR